MTERVAQAVPAPAGAQDTLRGAYDRLAAALAGAGIGSPGLDARLIVQWVSGVSHERFIAAPATALSSAASQRLEAALARRLAGEPVARIVGGREFWGREFVLSAETLVPRPESELLVEAGLAFLGQRDAGAPLIADLGTGSGCLIVSLLAECGAARGIGIDLAAGALQTAAHNAARHGVAGRALFARGDWLAPLAPASLDLIVANPPYIPSGDIAALAPEVSRFDSPLALDGGDDGLAAIRRIAAGAAAALKEGGLLAVEVGAGQAPAVAGLLVENGLGEGAARRVLSDLAGHGRVVLAVKKTLGNCR